MRRGHPLLPWFLCLSGLLAAFYPTIFSALDVMQADPGDTRHLNFVLEHGHRWLTRAAGHAPLWSPPVFFPVPNTGAYTELLLGVVPLYSVFRISGAAPDTAFQLWMLAVMALNFVAAFRLLRGPLGFSDLPAAFGAFLFAFGGARVNQLNHQHLLPHFFSVWIVHALVRAFQAGDARRARPWILAGCAAGVAQLYAGVYYGWFLGFALGIAAVVSLVLPDARPRLIGFLRMNAATLGVGLVLGAALLAPMGVHYLDAAKAVGFRQYDEALGMLPRFQSWLYGGPDNWIWGWLYKALRFDQVSVEGEQRVGLGVVTSGVLVWTLWRERGKPLYRVLALTTLAVILITTLYRGGHSPWAVVFRFVPGANAIRAVCRIGILMLFPAAIALAAFLERVEREPGRVRAVAVAVAAFCLAEQANRHDGYLKAVPRAQVEAVAKAVGSECRSFYYSAEESPRSAPELQLDAMWAALETGVPTVNGYSSNFPAGWELLDANVRSWADEQRLRRALDRWVTSRGLSGETVCWIRRPDLRVAP